MTGFKNFLLRGNLIELAVAFIMGGAFATVVKALVDVIMGLIGKAGGHADFNSYQPGGLPIGAFITALVAFIVIAAVVYYVIVVPYTTAKARYFPDPEETEAEELSVLKQIRDSLANR
jgi:large conductance mechanosensitive channel